MPLRTAFLDRIRAAVRDTVDDRLSWDALLAPTDDRAIFAAQAGRTREQRMVLLGRLMEQAAPLNLQVHACATLAEAAECIAALARAGEPEFHDRKSLILHEHPLLRALPLDARPELAGIPCHWTSVDDPRGRDHTLAAFVGITVADWGIAESATLVQLTRPGRPRSTSLVPSIHIALLLLQHLVADLAEAYALIRRAPGSDSLVLISGPSKTADIEACMVLGAHGPRAVHLIVLTGPSLAAGPGFPVARTSRRGY